MSTVETLNLPLVNDKVLLTINSVIVIICNETVKGDSPVYHQNPKQNQFVSVNV